MDLICLYKLNVIIDKFDKWLNDKEKKKIYCCLITE